MRAMKMRVLSAVLAALLLVLPAVYAHPVRVIGPDNTPADGVMVKAVNGTTVIAKGTTNSTGWVDLALKNGTIVFVVDYNTTADAVVVAAVTTYENESLNTPIVINMTTLHVVKIRSTGTKVNVTVVEPKTETELSYVANESMVYTTDELNYTYPREVSKFPYRYVFKELRYDGSTTTDNFVSIAPTTDIEITGVYERQWWIALTTEQLVIILIASAAIILILLAVTRGGARAIMEHRRQYWVR